MKMKLWISAHRLMLYYRQGFQLRAVHKTPAVRGSCQVRTRGEFFRCKLPIFCCIRLQIFRELCYGHTDKGRVVIVRTRVDGSIFR